MSATKTILAADLFCGAGGTSSGLLAACQAMGIELNLIAINHWPVAIDTHKANHAYAQHLCDSIDNVNPRKLVPGGRLHVLVASPECTHHSNARGGRPMSDQSRATAWHVLRWAEALYIENILIENVKEFRSWGPLGASGRPVKRLRGQLFITFIQSLRALGYRVEDKVLNAADFGDPTTRERLFIIARRGNRPISWPRPSHASAVNLRRQGAMFANAMKPWRTAREIIDWSIPAQSIFTRKRPLAPKTLARIAAGLKKFGGEYAEPFLVVLRRHADAQGLDVPLPTITAKGNHIGLCEPFLIGQQSGAVPRCINEPVPTVTTDGAIALVEPFIIGAGGPERAGKPRGINEPLNTILAKNSSALVEPFVIPFFGEREGQAPRSHSVDEPLPAVTSHGAGALVQPFLLNIDQQSGGDAVRAIDDLIETANGTMKLDIRFRMLEPHELAAAQGLRGYKFTGKKTEIVKQIGNAVPKGTATALCRELLQ